MCGRHVGAVVRVCLVLLLACGVTLGSLPPALSPGIPDAATDAIAARGDGKPKAKANKLHGRNRSRDNKHQSNDKAKNKGKAKGKHRGDGQRPPAALNSTRIAAANAVERGVDACPDLQQVKVGDRTYCTHGDDPSLFGGSILEEEGVGVRASGPAPRALCLDDGQSGPRVQLVYVHKNGHDRLNALLPTFRRLAAEMDTIVDQSARKTGGSLRLRFVTNAQCQVDVASVSVPSHLLDGFASLNQELARQGYDRLNRKYLMLVDAGKYCGIATFLFDDAPNTTKHNFTGYARVDAPCWDAGTMIHELSHTFGAVQYSAPHTSRGAHCIDEWDVMCYRDEPHHPKMKYLCQDGAQEFRLDCGNDDYFAAEPEPGSYLTQRWNMANSIYFVDGSGEICVDAALEPDDAYWYDAWGVPMPEFTVGQSQTRAFCEQPGDTDWVLFQGKRGTAYRIATSELGPEVDSQVVLYRGLKEQHWDGMDQIGFNDDVSEDDSASEIVFTAPSDGSYLVGISEAGSRAGLDKTYTLTIEQTVATQSGTLTLSRGKAKPKQRFTATMSGITPAATVTYWWQRGGDAQQLGQTAANSTGSAAATLAVPKGAAKGAYQVEALTSDGAFASATLKVTDRDGKSGKGKHKAKKKGKKGKSRGKKHKKHKKHKHKKGQKGKRGGRHAAGR